MVFQCYAHIKGSSWNATECHNVKIEPKSFAIFSVLFLVNKSSVTTQQNKFQLVLLGRSTTSNAASGMTGHLRFLLGPELVVTTCAASRIKPHAHCPCSDVTAAVDHHCQPRKCSTYTWRMIYRKMMRKTWILRF